MTIDIVTGIVIAAAGTALFVVVMACYQWIAERIERWA